MPRGYRADRLGSGSAAWRRYNGPQDFERPAGGGFARFERGGSSFRTRAGSAMSSVTATSSRGRPWPSRIYISAAALEGRGDATFASFLRRLGGALEALLFHERRETTVADLHELLPRACRRTCACVCASDRGTQRDMLTHRHTHSDESSQKTRRACKRRPNVCGLRAKTMRRRDDVALTGTQK